MYKYPVFITSKGRPQCPTAKLIPEAIIVVEDYEKDLYKHHPHQKLVLPERDKGLAWVRNYILNYAKEKGYKAYWVVDDDIYRIVEKVGTKTIRTDWKTACTEPEELMEKYHDKIGMVGLEYSRYMYGAKKKWREKNVCDCVVLINTNVADACQYDLRFKIKIDRDFTLQVLKAGFRVIKYCIIGFESPYNGKLSGGLQSVYQSGVEEDMSLLMCEKWKGICSMNYKKDGRPDVKIDWKKI